MDPAIVIVIGFVSNIIAILAVGWKLSQFVARIEVKVDLMWNQYTRQVRITDSNTQDSRN